MRGRTWFFLCVAALALLLSFDSHDSDGLVSPRIKPNRAEAASGALGPAPPNSSFDADGYSVGTPPTNSGFDTGDLTGWTTTGTVSVQTGGDDGNFARFDSINAEILSWAFDVPADAQTLTFKTVHLTSSSTCLSSYVMSGTNYATPIKLPRQLLCDQADIISSQ